MTGSLRSVDRVYCLMLLLLHINVARSICVNTSSEIACVAEREQECAPCSICAFAQNKA